MTNLDGVWTSDLEIKGCIIHYKSLINQVILFEVKSISFFFVNSYLIPELIFTTNRRTKRTVSGLHTFFLPKQPNQIKLLLFLEN